MEHDQLVKELEKYILGTNEELEAMKALIDNPLTRTEWMASAYKVIDFKMTVLSRILEKYK